MSSTLTHISEVTQFMREKFDLPIIVIASTAIVGSFIAILDRPSLTSRARSLSPSGLRQALW
jgi:hypothetical protein